MLTDMITETSSECLRACLSACVCVVGYLPIFSVYIRGVCCGCVPTASAARTHTAHVCSCVFSFVWCCSRDEIS